MLIIVLERFFLALSVFYILKYLLHYIYCLIKLNLIFHKNFAYDCRVDNVKRLLKAYRQKCIQEGKYGEYEKLLESHTRRACTLHYKYNIFIKNKFNLKTDDKVNSALYMYKNYPNNMSASVLEGYLVKVLNHIINNDELVKAMFLGSADENLFGAVYLMDEKFPQKEYKKYFRNQVDRTETLLDIIGLNDNFKLVLIILSIIYVLIYYANNL